MRDNSKMNNHNTCSKLKKMLQAQSKVQHINEARQLEQKVTSVENDMDQEPQIIGEAKSAMKDIQDLQNDYVDVNTLEKHIAMLNVDQKHVFLHVNDHQRNVRMISALAQTSNHYTRSLVVLEVLVNPSSSKLLDHR